MKAYKRINDESEAIAKKTNGRIDMCKSRNYTLTTIKFFKETTLVLQKSEKISEQESVWIDLAITGALIFTERYEGEANQYDPIAPEYAKENGLKVYLMNESPNTLIYEKNTGISRSNIFGKWRNILYNIKKEGGIAGKVNKVLLVSL
ncbi:2148_t:CDS:2 [Scutellospora calospora]|uniref:2148_t:CDS:1 n=1 Tax=Scutellospora calospora TaxID=85575 RepID=A0ACA9KL98_9GLOM|nr:2148_t:CDS:2 [Scutellospora calospora]